MRTNVNQKQAVVLAVAAFVALGACACSAPAVKSATPVYEWGAPGSRGAVVQLEQQTPTLVSGISGNVVQIATSNSDVYALTSTGEVWAWGLGSYGELGDGQTTSQATQAVKVGFPAGVKIAALPNPMPFDGALAIDSTGRVWGWGDNPNFDLCLSGPKELRPKPISLTDVTLATGARTHSLFDSHGRLYSCGSGQYGELGDHSTASSAQPVEVTGLPKGAQVTALVSAWANSGALLSNGDYYNWGYNAAGELGDGNTAYSDVPVKVKLAAAVRQVFEGGSVSGNGQTVAVLTNGSVVAWGDNTRGQLGDGSTTHSDVPVAVKVPAGVTFVQVNTGGYSSYAIDSAGRLWAWGGNQHGQVGTGAHARTITRPVDVRIHLTQVSSTSNNVAGLDDSHA